MIRYRRRAIATRHPIAAQREEREELFQVFEYLDKKITHEHTLIGHRMGWLVTGQTILFAAWSNQSSSTRRTILYAGTGFLIAIVAGLGTNAALRVVDELGGRYSEAVECALGVPPMGRRRASPWTLKLGSLSTQFLPPLFAALWAAIGTESVYSWHFSELRRADILAAWTCLVVFVAFWTANDFLFSTRSKVQPPLSLTLRRAVRKWKERGHRDTPLRPDLRWLGLACGVALGLGIAWRIGGTETVAAAKATPQRPGCETGAPSNTSGSPVPCREITKGRGDADQSARSPAASATGAAHP